MEHAQLGAGCPARAAAGAPAGIELRHLRYFVALADEGSFTHAAARTFIAQPTLSQQIRRLEEIVGTALLHRRREGLQLTTAGSVRVTRASPRARRTISLLGLQEAFALALTYFALKKSS